MASRNIPLATYNLVASQAQTAHAHGAPAARGAVRTASVVCPASQAPPPPPPPAHILICAELARLCIALHFGLCFRVWLILFQLARENHASGFTRAQIENGLRRYNVKFSTRNLTRWLHSGTADGLFWHYDTKTCLYYHRGYGSLAESLVTRTIERGELEWIDTNFPGQRRPVHLNVASDNLLQFESNCFESWIGSRENLTISRQELCTIWARTIAVLHSWEAVNPAIEKLLNYTFCDEAHYKAIPLQADGTWRPDVHRTTLNGRDVIAWQLPNSYNAPRIRQHPKKGQLRYVFVLMKEYIREVQAAGDCEQGGGHSAVPGGSNRTAKMYYASNKSAKESCNRHGESARHVFKGRWGKRYGYYEYTPDGVPQFDFWQVRRVFRRHQCVSFAKRCKKIARLKMLTMHPF